MSKGHKREDIGKTLRAADGKVFRVTQIIACRWVPGEEGKRARCLVHHEGWHEFTGRSADKLPERKFKHIRSKIQGMCPCKE